MAARWRISPVLLCVVAIALATGAAASLVSTATGPVGTDAVRGDGFSVSTTVLGLCLILPFVVGFGAMLYTRMRDGGLRLPRSIVIFALSFLLVLGLFAIFGGYLSPGTLSPPSAVTSPGHGNVSTGPGNTSNNSGGTGTSTPGGGLPSQFHLPGGALLLIAGVVALAIAGIAIPAVWGAVAGRRSRGSGPTPPAVAAVGAALARASADLDAGTDPRAVIERLYVRLLDRVVQVAGDVSGRTPEEIRSDQLVPLGVRPAAAEALTRLFEEARYSTHPMGAEAAARVRAAVAAASTDLARSAVAR